MPGTLQATEEQMEFDQMFQTSSQPVLEQQQYSELTFAVKGSTASTNRSIQVQNVDEVGVYEYRSDFHTSFDKDDLIGNTRDLLKDIIAQAAQEAAS